MSEVRADDPAAIAAELGKQFEIARLALSAVGDLARKLQRRARQAAAASGPPRLVRVKVLPPVDPATGEKIKRGRGRPPGRSNNVCLIATDAQIEQLRQQLARHTPTSGR